tara:strand:- start:795 stop:947 length:153 start_codon:yes stop_codon:yes gene_type:complete
MFLVETMERLRVRTTENLIVVLADTGFVVSEQATLFSSPHPTAKRMSAKG